MGGALHEKSSLLKNADRVLEEDCEDEGFGDDGSGACFQLLLFLRWQRCVKQGEGVSLLQAGENRERSLWMIRNWKKEAKENKKKNVVIRKLRAYANNVVKNSKRRRPTQFQYDPQSYALNFDEGQGEDDEFAAARLGFSSRFAASLKTNNG